MTPLLIVMLALDAVESETLAEDITEIKRKAPRQRPAG
jgi:hypothetical protein